MVQILCGRLPLTRLAPTVLGALSPLGEKGRKTPLTLHYHGRASTPPVSGRGTPVVPGSVIGKLRMLRTAR